MTCDHRIDTDEPNHRCLRPIRQTFDPEYSDIVCYLMNDHSPAIATASLAGPTDAPLAIEADSLAKTYTEGLIFRKSFDALKGVSFSVNQGEIFGLLGPNGAGKTTFIKILLGIIRKTGGNARMLGYPAGSRQGRKMVGYLPEHLRITAKLTVNTAL